MRFDHRMAPSKSIFSKEWVHSFIVDHNLLLHQEAIRVCTKIVADWLADRRATSTIRILDLECGETPIIMNGVMKQFAIHRFDYHGVDSDGDRIETAKKFQFSPNIKVELMEGNCWQPVKLIQQPVDIVFMGFNTHHAVPEELMYFVDQITKIMSPNGLFLNYDLFRPTQFPYLRRPDHTCDGARPLTLIAPEILEDAGIMPMQADHHPGLNWRQHFLTSYIAAMKQENCPKTIIDDTIAHITERDYPVSAAEMCSILKGSGFRTQTVPLNSDSPLVPFFDVVAATL